MLPLADREHLAALVARLPQRKAWLFDLDGTIVDTMPLHYRSYAALMRDHGGELTPAAFDAHVGPPARVAIPLFARAAGLDPASLPDLADLHARKKTLFRELLERNPPPLLPAGRLLASLPPGVRAAVVTSGNRDGATAILAAIGLSDRLDAIVTGDDVARGKPDPEPYAMARRALGAAPADCLAFEDHPDGIASARAAGVDTIDVVSATLLRAR